MQEGKRNENLNNSVAKAITILNCFSYEKPRLRVKEISELTELNQPTVCRYLATLKEFGLMEQHGTEYTLGCGFLKYEGIVLNSMEIRRIGLPYLEELSHKLRVNVNLAILDENEVVFVARAETTYCVYGYFHIGMRRPIYCTALGKVLTCRSPEIIQAVFRKGVHRYTLHTITEEARFLQEVEQVALQGYATDFEEWSNGVNCIAAPLYDATGKIAAGISISGPVTVYSQETIVGLAPTLIECANRISGRLGFRGGGI